MGEGYGMEKKRLSVRPIMLGLTTAMGAYLVLLTLAAYLTVSGRLDEVRIGQAVWACACLAAFGGAMTASGEKRGTAVLPLLALRRLGMRVADWTARVGCAGPEWGAGAARGVCAWRAACGGLARRGKENGQSDIKRLVPDGKHKDRKTAHSARRERIAQIWPGGGMRAA